MRLFLASATLLVACGSSSTTKTAPPPASAPPSAQPWAPPAPPPPPAASAAPIDAGPPRVEIPTPLTDDEKKTLSTTCKPLMDEYSKRTSVTKDRMMITSVVNVIESMVEKPPPGLAPECLPLFERRTHGEVIDRLEHDARSTLERTASNMRQVYEKEKQLRAVPAGSAYLAISTTSRENGMTVLVRATPFRDRKVIEWTMDASVKDGALVFGPIAMVK